ncbi:MAG: hypothetical protein ACKVOQ_12355 [Cyclobacteriaceae bacterium]
MIENQRDKKIEGLPNVASAKLGVSPRGAGVGLSVASPRSFLTAGFPLLSLTQAEFLDENIT